MAELSAEASGKHANVTGVVATLLERGIAVSIEDVKAVLKELHDEDKIMVDGDDFYNVS